MEASEWRCTGYSILQSDTCIYVYSYTAHSEYRQVTVKVGSISKPNTTLGLTNARRDRYAASLDIFNAIKLLHTRSGYGRQACV